jgi:hypothetical protein
LIASIVVPWPDRLDRGAVARQQWPGNGVAAFVEISSDQLDFDGRGGKAVQEEHSGRATLEEERRRIEVWILDLSCGHSFLR